VFIRGELFRCGVTALGNPRPATPEALAKGEVFKRFSPFPRNLMPNFRLYSVNHQQFTLNKNENKKNDSSIDTKFH